MKILVGVTSYNRPSYLNDFLSSLLKFSNFKKYKISVIIVDDNSSLDVISVVKKFKKFLNIIFIKNKVNMGVHYSTNIILKYFDKNKFDVGFKADDDIFFKNIGWMDIYIEAMFKTKYHHLTYFSENWKAKSFEKKIVLEKIKLVSKSNVMNSLGCFWTFTPEVLKSVGHFDFKNFGKRGYGHIDFSMRCCRAGFNDANNFYHPYKCEEYISMQMREGYVESIPYSEVKRLNSKNIIRKKLNIINRKDRVYVK